MIHCVSIKRSPAIFTGVSRISPFFFQPPSETGSFVQGHNQLVGAGALGGMQRIDPHFLVNELPLELPLPLASPCPDSLP